MSSSSVCQGLQSCLEPRLMEPRVLRLKLAPAKSNFSRSIALTTCFAHPDNLKNESHPEENTTTNTTTITSTDNKNNRDNDCDVKSRKIDDIGGWSFLQFLASNSQNNTKDNTENEKVYVHPLVKRSSSALSEKSLEMCTESLGSETGSQVSESSDDISLISPETEISSLTDTSKLRERFMTKRTNRGVSFPPPLTSISGSSGVQVRPHREAGRLVLQAVAVSSSQAYFHAERRDGRLRLCLVKDRTPADIDNQEEDAADDEGEEEEEEEEEEWIGEEEFDEEEKVEEEYDEDEDEDEEEEEEEDEVYWGEDMEGKSKKVRGQIGVEKLARPLRCKESGRGNEGLLNWEPYWVAT